MANVTYTVQNKNGSYDGDMVLKQYTSMTINGGDTVTVDQPCRGLFIYVTGDVTINGTLSMNHRGASANPTSSGGSDSNAVDSNGLRLGLFAAGGSDTLTSAATLFNGCGTAVRTAIANQPSINSNGVILQSIRANTSVDGFNNVTRNSSSSYGTPSAKSLVANSTGSGGRGGYWMNNARAQNYVFGGYSSCFGGGSGGGGWNGNGNSSAGTNTNATNYGGQGGSGASNHSYNGMGGGAGNGAGGSTGNVGVNAQNGTGGCIWLIVGGNITIGGSGIICADGANGGGINSGGDFNSGGGGSGGGRIIIAHKGTYTNNGTVQANGGSGGSKVAGYSEAGQAGMNGAITVQQIQ
jgi:hypothetical protein